MTGRARQANRDARAEDRAVPAAELLDRPLRDGAPRRIVRLVCGRCRRRVGVLDVAADLDVPPAPRCRCGHAPRHGRAWWEAALDAAPLAGGTVVV